MVWVLVGTVAGIDDGHWSELACVASGAFDVVTHHNQVGIVAHHHDGVLERFTFAAAGGVGVGEADDASAKAVDSGFKTQSGAGRRFEKQRRHHFPGEDVAIRVRFEMACFLNQFKDFVLGEVVD